MRTYGRDAHQTCAHTLRADVVRQRTNFDMYGIYAKVNLGDCTENTALGGHSSR